MLRGGVGLPTTDADRQAEATAWLAQRRVQSCSHGRSMSISGGNTTTSSMQAAQQTELDETTENSFYMRHSGGRDGIKRVSVLEGADNTLVYHSRLQLIL